MEESAEYNRLLADFVATRNEAGLSQRALGKEAGVAQNIIARIESQTRVPSVVNFLKLLAPMGKTLAIIDVDPQK